jgi:predicted RNA-binding Zn ribbon-like protein
VGLLSNRKFQLVGGHAALDLVNSLDWRFRRSGAKELLETYGDLLSFMVQAGLLKKAEARGLARSVGERRAGDVLRAGKALREVLANFFYSVVDGGRPASGWVQALEEQIEEACKQQRLAWRGARLEWSWAQAGREAELPVWVLAVQAAELSTSDSLIKVRTCDNAECRWLFLDTSKNQRRKWCDMKLCGNRMKSRRFKAKRKG